MDLFPRTETHLVQYITSCWIITTHGQGTAPFTLSSSSSSSFLFPPLPHSSFLLFLIYSTITLPPSLTTHYSNPYNTHTHTHAAVHTCILSLKQYPSFPRNTKGFKEQCKKQYDNNSATQPTTTLTSQNNNNNNNKLCPRTKYLNTQSNTYTNKDDNNNKRGSARTSKNQLSCPSRQ